MYNLLIFFSFRTYAKLNFKIILSQTFFVCFVQTEARKRSCTTKTHNVYIVVIIIAFIITTSIISLITSDYMSLTRTVAVYIYILYLV